MIVTDMTHAYFMRHGQTNYNLQGLCNADPSRDVHLTPLGQEQARQAALQLKSVPLELIIASPLPRTRETAAIVHQYHQCDIQYEAAIIDIRSGCEDRPVTEYQAAIARDPLHLRVNGGESVLEHKQRILTFLQGLREKEYRHILVVAHEETLRVIYAYFQHLSDEAMLELHFNNCEIIQFEMP